MRCTRTETVELQYIDRYNKGCSLSGKSMEIAPALSLCYGSMCLHTGPSVSCLICTRLWLGALGVGHAKGLQSLGAVYRPPG